MSIFYVDELEGDDEKGEATFRSRPFKTVERARFLSDKAGGDVVVLRMRGEMAAQHRMHEQASGYDPKNEPAAPRTTNVGPWAEWIAKLSERDRERVFFLAERILPTLCSPVHTREDIGHDDAAISTALRIAQRFYARIGMFGSKPQCSCGNPDCKEKT